VTTIVTNESHKKRKPTPPRSSTGPGKVLPRVQASPTNELVSAYNRLIVQFQRPEDPTRAETALVHAIVKKYAGSARTRGEFPGVLRVDVRAGDEAEFRREIEALTDWQVASEGFAEMPPQPLPEDFEHGKPTN
jgi:hypothetical protein